MLTFLVTDIDDNHFWQGTNLISVRLKKIGAEVYMFTMVLYIIEFVPQKCPFRTFNLLFHRNLLIISLT